MSNFTPGPWKAVGIHPGEWSDDPLDGTPTLTIHDDQPYEHWNVKRVHTDENGCRVHTYVAQVHVTHDRHEEAEANARLIAAAPELYEALSVLLEVTCGRTALTVNAHARANAERRARAALAAAQEPGRD